MTFPTKIAVSLLSVAVTGTGSWVFNTSGRVATLEAHRTDDSARLERIENKLDKLLERK